MPEAAWCRRAGFTLRTKYKGHHNRNTQIRGTFSSDGAFLICGSDDGWVYVWTTGADEDKAAVQVTHPRIILSVLVTLTKVDGLETRA